MDKILGVFKYFFGSLYHGIVFGIQEYDSELQLHKTPRQRIIFWSVVVVAVITISLLLVRGIAYVVSNIAAQRLEEITN